MILHKNVECPLCSGWVCVWLCELSDNVHNDAAASEHDDDDDDDDWFAVIYFNF